MRSLLILLAVAIANVAPAEEIVCPRNAPQKVKLAAREVRRYVYLRTGTLLPIAESGKGISLKIDRTLDAQQYRLKTRGDTLAISGGSDVGVLYGAYRYAELLGVRFAIDGDVIPDERLDARPAVKDQTGKPLFSLRGLQPFHDFPEGPDWWTTDDWKAILGQAAKMRMNFVGLHTYPFHNTTLGPEPTVWVGLPEDVNPDGTVKLADPASWYTTAKFQPYGCYQPEKTGDYSFGSAEVFPTDHYGPEINSPDDFPFPKTPAANVAMINRTGFMLKKVFDEAHALGMTTCVGTEAPLDVPDTAKARLKELNLKPTDPAALRKLYEGMFTRITRAYPVDYYWLWGHEGEIDENRFVGNVRAAHEAAKSIKAPFGVGVCGWGWTAGHFPSLDRELPKDVFFSAISMNTGHAPVSENFARLAGRQKWAIPWLEDDGSLGSIQLRAGRMRRDAVDARRYGCNGLMGIFWRTRVLDPNIAALAQAAWEQPTPGKGPMPRDLPVADFYRDWAVAQFGPQAGRPAAEIFTKLDGNFPIPSGWIKGPGTILINRKPWASVAPAYAFVDQLAALRPQVAGAGNLERFDWWLNTFRATRAMARFGCARGELDAVVHRIEKSRNPEARRRLARQQALPLRLQMVTLLGDLHNALLASLTNASELGAICNVEQQSMLRLKLLTGQDAKLAGWLGEPLPAAARPWKDYRGPARLVVLSARTKADRGESLALRVVALDKQPARSVVVRHRRLGEGAWQTLPAAHLGRAVYEAKLPPAADDFEYYVESQSSSGATLRWPAAAPKSNHTVVVVEP